MNTIQTNKLIVEFMGIDFMNNKIFINRLPKDFIDYSDSYKCFHNSWDWLMEVVEKIEAMEIKIKSRNELGQFQYETFTPLFEIYYNQCRINRDFGIDGLEKDFLNCFTSHKATKLESTYNGCVKFIEWYNKEIK